MVSITFGLIICLPSDLFWPHNICYFEEKKVIMDFRVKDLIVNFLR